VTNCIINAEVEKENNFQRKIKEEIIFYLTLKEEVGVSEWMG
jgi:hypothetical protein